MKFAIRSFKMEELDEILRVYESGFREITRNLKKDVENFRNELSQAISSDLPGNLLVAVSGDKIIGFASYVKKDHWHFGPIAVHPSKQRQDVGKSLLEECIRRMKSEGGGRVTLIVQKKNKEALSLYEKMGFRITSHVMEREL
ncbi:MAG: GNAT family N-acetyltransferase [Candidatus Helarchaeota archaeon]